MDQDFFKNNRQKFREVLNKDIPVILTANGVLQRNSDVTFPFRQDSSFWYLTGVNQPDFILVIHGAKEFLVAPFRSRSQSVMEGQLNLIELSKSAGLTVFDYEKGWAKITAAVKKYREIASLEAAPLFLENNGFYTNPARLNLIQKIKDINKNTSIVDVRGYLANLRVIKQPSELKSLQKAIDITSEAVTKVKRQLKSYRFENEIEADITKDFLQAGSKHAFTPIIAAGVNAATIHYVANNGPIKKGELVLLDIGAEINNYAADISRTLAAAKPTKRQQAIYDAVLETQDYAKEQLKPGVIYKELEQKIEKYIGKKLQQLKLTSSNKREEIRKYYPHATSHFLGLDTHDLGNYSDPLRPGMVLTVEPGIYVPEEKIGVRLEDDVLITKSGTKVLSGALPLNLS